MSSAVTVERLREVRRNVEARVHRKILPILLATCACALAASCRPASPSGALGAASADAGPASSPAALDPSAPPTSSSTGAPSPPCPLSEPWCQDALTPRDKCVALPAVPHFDWKPIPELVGLAVDELRICYGDAVVGGVHELTWRIPQHCAFEKVELEVHILNGHATSARAHTFVTFQHCM